VSLLLIYCSSELSTPFLYTENFYLAFLPNINVTSSGKEVTQQQ